MRVPEGDWFIRAVLYWDQVRFILPEALHGDRQLLGDYTMALVDAGLVRATRPERHIHGIPGFDEGFIRLLDGAERGESSDQHPPIRMHFDKMGQGLAQELRERRLAHHADEGGFMWLNVEAQTARVFAAYLAIVLSSRGNMRPLTDDETALAAVQELSRGISPGHAERAGINMALLTDVLPAPGGDVDIDELATFKADNTKLLRGFRNRVEKSVLRVLDITDADHRSEMLDREKMSLEDELATVVEKFERRRWKVVLGDMGVSALAAAPDLLIGGSPASGGASALLAAMQSLAARKGQLKNEPLAYAAFAHKKLASGAVA